MRSRRLIFILLLITLSKATAQDQRIADSLIVITESSSSLTDSVLLKIYEAISFNHGTAKIALEYADKVVVLATELEDPEMIYRGHALKGMVHQTQGQMQLALNSFFESVESAKRIVGQRCSRRCLLEDCRCLHQYGEP